MEHEDFGGHHGIIGPGELQYMTAGRGIVHTEVPGSEGENKGFQLWVNLKRKDKLVKPDYQELGAKKVPKARTEDGGVEASIIAGAALGIESPVHTRQPVYYADFRMLPGATLQHPIPSAFNAFLYVLQGSLTVGPEEKASLVPVHHTAVLSLSKGAAEALLAEQKAGGKKKKATEPAGESGESEESAAGGGKAKAGEGGEGSGADWQDGVHIRAGKKGARFILVAGEPTNEPVVQHGPFVMTSQEEIMQAFRDYQTGRHGFEKARGWESKAVSERRVMV